MGVRFAGDGSGGSMGLGILGMVPVLAVIDVAESIRFYRDVIGFEVVSVEDDGDDIDFALLRLGAVQLMLSASDLGEVANEGGAGRGFGSGAGFGLVFDCDNVDAVFSILRQRSGDVVAPAMNDLGVRQIYLTDPDGYKSCFQAMAAL